MKAFWEWFLRIVPAPLRTTLIVVSGLLAAYVQGAVMIRQMTYRDVILDGTFLVCLTLGLAVLAVQFLRCLKGPWNWISSIALLALTFFIGIKSWTACQFEYNDQGFFSMRHWQVEPGREGETKLFMQIMAASNAPAQLVIKVETNPGACPGILIEDFAPELPHGIDVQGAETLEPQPNVRQFTFENFRRPELINFHLTLRNVSSVSRPEDCFSSSATSDAKPASDPIAGAEHGGEK